jgi:mannosyltransferase
MVDTGDADGLAQAVMAVMQDPEQALRMGQAAQQRVAEHFSLAQEAAGIGRVYQQLFDAA